MTTASQADAQFPLPPDLDGFWTWDKMHSPRPQTPLTDEIATNHGYEGFNGAHDEFGLPIHFVPRTINYYSYNTIVPAPLGDETMEQRLARYEKTLAEIVPRVGELWESEWLPSILPGLEKAKTLDYGSLTDGELLETLEELRRDFVQRYVVHGRINFVTIAASWFGDFYNEAFSPEDPTEAYQVLQGFPTRSVDAGRALWRLSRIVKGNAELTNLFEQVEPRELVSQLESSDAGRSFLIELGTFLDEFGWRSDVFELADASWREDPTIPLNALQGYIRLGEDGDPDVHYQEAIRTRERLLAQARERLAGDGEKVARFEALYDGARHYLNVTEDHNFYIDQIGNTVMRLPILELGRRLVRAGAVEGANDVFLLYVAEIGEGLAGKDHKRLVAQRRAEMKEWAKVVPVPAIGTPPPPTGDPFEGAMAKMFGMPAEPSRDANIINGVGASAGTVQGRAKVVRNLSEASKVEPGDVLVCEMTMPPWTPLFSTVSAVVADTGGILSHCAIVAREYRVPCVVQTIVGTAQIKDGMLLTVDGSRGIVRIDSRTA